VDRDRRQLPPREVFTYSRSWRVETIRPLLYAFGALPNVKLWLSADRDSGLPADVPTGIRVAWLQDNRASALRRRPRVPGQEAAHPVAARGGAGVRAGDPRRQGQQLLVLPRLLG